jgi:peroxiredoxin Q/BCP
MARPVRAHAHRPPPARSPSLRCAPALAVAFALSGCSAGNLLAPGAHPPESLSAVDQHGQVRSIGAQKGQPLVVYFYPKDGTPGCTEEACAFRDAWDRYAKAGVMVFGVSGDDQESKAEFAKEEKLPFPILADPEHRWAEAFGVGTTLGMMDRVTFLLDATGAVAKVYPDVDPGVHAAEVLEDAKGLGAGSAR